MTKKKTYSKAPSDRLKKAVDIMVASGGKKTKGEALKEAGYSDAIAKNPHKITRSKTYRDYMDQVGLTSTYLSKKHRQLSNAMRLEKDRFDAVCTKIGKGKKEKYEYTHIPDSKIKLLIEGDEDNPTGNKIAWIKTFETHKEVWFRVPDNLVQKGALDMAFKVRGDYTADKAFEDLANHIMGKEEEEEIDSILTKNKK